MINFNARELSRDFAISSPKLHASFYVTRVKIDAIWHSWALV